MKISKIKRVRYQRDIELDSYSDLISGVQEKKFDIANDVIAILSKKGKLLELNFTSAFLWENLTDQTNLEELTELFTEFFEVSKGEARQDIIEAVRHLEKLEFVDVISD